MLHPDKKDAACPGAEIACASEAKRGKLFEIQQPIAIMSKLTEYLLDLAADPDRCARFKADPLSELGSTDLSEVEKSAVASRDPERISAAIINADADPESIVLFHWLSAIFGEVKPGS